MAAWCLFDAHSVDGKLDGYTPEALDELIGWPGFARAMAAVDWLLVGDHYLETPRFDCHNGKSAKRRATESDRKRDVREMSASDADKKRTREEKRREEKKNPPNPRKRGSGVRFDDFWLAWPKSERKQDKIKCLDHWKLHQLDGVAEAILADVRSKRGTKKWREGHIEAPLTYLRGKRWEDGQTPRRHAAAGRRRVVGNPRGVEGKAKTIGMPGWDGVELFDDYRGRVKVRVQRRSRHECAHSSRRLSRHAGDSG
jgi:hypothetical protein